MKFIHNILLAGALLTSTGNLFAADETSYTELTGTYIGTYRFEMNSNDENMIGESLEDIDLIFNKVTPEGTQYSQLGYSIKNGLWKWDFDNMKVSWGGNTLFALNTFKLHVNLFNQDVHDSKVSELDFATFKYTNTHPEILSNDEITMPIIDNEDGTYSVDFSKKIYFAIPGYPIGKTTTTFKITLENEELKIVTIDSENDGGELDTIPGSRIVGVFPFVVQPSYYSVMMKKEIGTDTNNDGISDLEAEFLGLEASVLDTDKDGISDYEEIKVTVNPIDSDDDGIPDYKEPGESANVGSIFGYIENDAGPSFSLEVQDSSEALTSLEVAGQLTDFSDFNPTIDDTENDNTTYYEIGDSLPLVNENTKEIRYKYFYAAGQNSYNVAPRYKLTFEGDFPDNFKIYGLILEETGKYTDYVDPDFGNTQQIIKINYTKLEYSINDKVVTIEPYQSVGRFGYIYPELIFAMGEKTKAYLVESSIEGLAYDNTGYEGKTLADGSFYYGSESVELSVGDVTLGTLASVNDDGKIFIQDIVGVDRTNIEDENVLKIAQFLYSLDSDLETDAIEISDAIFEKFQDEDDTKTDILSSDFNVETILTTNSIDIKPMSEVKEKLTKTLITEGLLSTSKAYFIDSAVEGIQYKNSNIEGKTSADGSFNYIEGEVEFFVGDISIGKLSSINEDGKIFIQDIVGVDRENIEDEKVLKIAQFLQSLDKDPSTNEIEISTETFEKFQENDDTKVDILSSNFNVEDVLTANNIEVKEMDDVTTHLTKALVDNNIIEEETTTSSGGSGGSFSWLLLLSLFGFSFFKSKKNKI